MAIKKTKKVSKKTSAKKSASGNQGLDAVMAQYGVEVVRKVGDTVKIPRIETELLGLDDMLGGGIPTGRVIEIYGPESSGKTTVAVMIGGAFQRAGQRGAIIDVEHALDPVWASKLGLDVEKCIHVTPDSGEDALNITRDLITNDAADYFIIDSVAALTTAQEMGKKIGDSNVGGQAKMMSQALKMLICDIAKSGKTVVFINQLRKKIGVMFGNPEVTSGGEALKYYSSIRLDVRRTGSRKEGDKAIGNTVRIKAVKNKTSAPFREREFFLSFTNGYDKAEDLINLAVEHEVVSKAGAWFSFDSLKEQGIENFKTALRSSPALYKDVYLKTQNIIEKNRSFVSKDIVINNDTKSSTKTKQSDDKKSEDEESKVEDPETSKEEVTV